MFEITIDYCSNYKTYDGSALKSGQVLAPIVFSQAMMDNDNTIVNNNLITWTLYDIPFKIGFIAVEKKDFNKIVSIFHLQINAFFEEHPELRPNRCALGWDKEGFPILCCKENHCNNCPRHLENLQHYKSSEDILQFISLQETSEDEEGNTVSLDIADPNVFVEDEAIFKVLFSELVDYLDKINPHYAKIVTLRKLNYTKEQIIAEIGVNPSLGNQEINTAMELTHEFLNL